MRVGEIRVKQIRVNQGLGVLPLHLEQLLIIWIFTEGEGDGIDSRLYLLKSFLPYNIVVTSYNV